MLRLCPFYTYCVENFVINVCWILSNTFSVSEMIIWFLSFILLMWYITLIVLQLLNHLCIPGINPTLSWCMTLLIYYCICFADILLRIFASMFIFFLSTIIFFCACVLFLGFFGFFFVFLWGFFCLFFLLSALNLLNFIFEALKCVLVFYFFKIFINLFFFPTVQQGDLFLVLISG